MELCYENINHKMDGTFDFQGFDKSDKFDYHTIQRLSTSLCAYARAIVHFVSLA